MSWSRVLLQEKSDISEWIISRIPAFWSYATDAIQKLQATLCKFYPLLIYAIACYFIQVIEMNIIWLPG